MKQSTLPRAVLFVACAALSLIVLTPFAMILVNSLKNARESALFGLNLPKEFQWKNYAFVLSKPAVIRGFINTIFVAVVTVLCTNVFAAMAAYIIQRRPGKLSRTLYYVFLLGLIIPVSIIPTIRLMMDLGIHNTYRGIILYYIAVNLPFTVFLFTGFMSSVPKEMDEAAMIEGCGKLRMFFQIILPLLSTVFVTSTIVVAISVWDDFLGPFYLISDYKKWTIVLNIYSFVSQYETNWGYVFAFLMLVMIPILILYFALQRYIISGVTAGSVKG
ncbi:MAG TPA: carbohydrate ABC transporter permease [Rectinemataceae bacterium]|nr:carbohydrate ABC transporter permease [Rectinemataceae bacterium]